MAHPERKPNSTEEMKDLVSFVQTDKIKEGEYRWVEREGNQG